MVRVLSLDTTVDKSQKGLNSPLHQCPLPFEGLHPPQTESPLSGQFSGLKGYAAGTQSPCLM